VPSGPPIALRLQGQDQALEPGRDYLLGSAPDCDLRLMAETVAPHHARISVGDQVELVDLGSAHGTLRNGERIDRTPLAIGDLITLGSATALLVPDHGEALIVPLPEMRAAASLRRVARQAAASVRRLEPQTFQQLMAEELRRAPWLLLSLALHVLLLVGLWLLMPARPLSGEGPRTVNIALAGGAPIHDDRPLLPDVVSEPAPEPNEVQVEPPAPSPPEQALIVEAERETPGLRSNPRIAARPPQASPSRGGRDGALQGIGSGTFRQTVGQLRKSGLEIVFVFDSTGSMTRTITDTKTTIAQMLTVLRALVPDARIGLVTYRDRGARETYVTRQVPLGLDFWRAANFVQVVTAEGGGDRPEEVRAGLLAAFEQEWQPNARRVVILAGDAPPHGETQDKLLREVRAFAQNGRSYVHTLVTSPGSAGADTQRSFAEIAKAGHGACLDMNDHDRVMQRVLDLAFGREFGQDLAAVTRAIEADAQKTETWALDLSRRGGPNLAATLRQHPVEDTLLNALVRKPRRRVMLQLLDLLGQPETPSHTRQAIGWVLQRTLELSVPPVDPVEDRGPTARELQRLRTLASRLPE